MGLKTHSHDSDILFDSLLEFSSSAIAYKRATARPPATAPTPHFFISATLAAFVPAVFGTVLVAEVSALPVAEGVLDPLLAVDALALFPEVFATTTPDCACSGWV